MERKKGQVTIFIIIAVLVVAAGIMVYLFVPQIRTGLRTTTENPSDFFEACIIDTLRENTETISLQGGSMEPEHYRLYDNSKVEYLCYTIENRKLCSVQRPFLKQHIENELKESIEDEARMCFNLLKESFERRGYDVSLSLGAIKVELLPKRVVIISNTEVTLTKGDSERYEEFIVVLNNNLYELVGIARSIVEWEATLGEAEPLSYMKIYHDLKVEKLHQSDGSKVYVITDKNTGNKFQLASRSMVIPPGI